METKTNKQKSLAKEIAKNNTIREKIIKKEDVDNFLILLNTAKSFDDFLERC